MTDSGVFAAAAAVLEEEQRRLDAETASQPVQPTSADELVGVGAATMSLRQVLTSGSVRLIAALTAVNLLDNMDAQAFNVLGPDIQRSFHLSDAGLGALNGVGSILLFTAAVPLGLAADRYRRTLIAGVCALVAGLTSIGTGLAFGIVMLVAVRVVQGAGKASTLPVHASLIADGYPVEGRSRMFAIHNIGPTFSGLLGPLGAGGLATLVGGQDGWRVVFPVIGVLTVIFAVFLFSSREPVRGGYERAAVLGDAEAAVVMEHISFSMARERLLKIRTLFLLYAGIGVFGFAAFGLPPFFSLLLQREYGLDSFHRGIAFAVLSLGGLIGLPFAGAISDKLFRRSPKFAVLGIAGAILGYGLAFSAAVAVHSLYATVAIAALASAAVTIGFISGNGIIAGVVPYQLRALGFALLGIYTLMFGGEFGGIITGALTGTYGIRSGIVLGALPACVVGAAIMAYASRFIVSDMALIVDELKLEEQEAALAASGQRDTAPALEVINVDFSYGPTQVLFGVSFEVARGEVLALLGTNGAGKSTILRAISGLGGIDRGIVRFEGHSVTYTDAERRVAMGIVQVPGGKAIFPSLTVAENLRAGTYLYGYDNKRVAAAFDRALTLFPKLKERLDQPAGTLSGGEQQMLAVAKAVLLEPKLLLIDELSLGLAPVVVQDLIETVATLRAEGLSMIIVEQSLNVALALADRAIFLEKGQVRFSGAARELLERDDLARAVFLGGKGDA